MSTSAHTSYSLSDSSDVSGVIARHELRHGYQQERYGLPVFIERMKYWLLTGAVAATALGWVYLGMSLVLCYYLPYIFLEIDADLYARYNRGLLK